MVLVLAKVMNGCLFVAVLRQDELNMLQHVHVLLAL
jgi:hypothetical protein